MKAGTGGFVFGFAAMVFSMPDMQQAESPPRDERAPAQEAQALPGMQHPNPAALDCKAGRETEACQSQLSNQSVPTQLTTQFRIA